MKVGIIVYSYTEKTFSVALTLQQSLLKENIDAQIKRIHAENEVPSNRKIKLTQAPDIAEYDVIIFATPVRAFTIAPITKQYLEQLNNFKKKSNGICDSSFCLFFFRWNTNHSCI